MNEVKVKFNLIEYYFCCILVPIVGIIFATIMLVWGLFIDIDLQFINGLIVVYIICICLAIINFIICFCVSKNTKQYAIFYEEHFFINETKESYNYKDIATCKYYICKWYMIPFYCVYKMQAGGLLKIITTENEKIEFQILYKDFKKVKEKFNNIEII